ncbi:MAG TPA: cytochrome d ubiquinol oxidase subunit II [Syntrophomonadaceae bacterium]|nr:cytochrome d ubiquinol oxidase subunit II [Syntrophomonadaceae bacterium]
MDLNITWFLLVGVLIGGYAVLDGFDLGVGSLYPLLGKTEEQRLILLQSIGPFWDGNEVWLLTGAGAIFAAFPLVYASVFSGFYLAMMLVLLALILRVIAVEFRNQAETLEWRTRLDVLFFLGSFLPALLFGVAMGNIARGLPLNSAHYYTGGFFGLLNPYALLIGFLGLFAFLLQGNSYVLLKTDGVLQEKARRLFLFIWASCLTLYVLASLYTYAAVPALFANYQKYTWFLIAPLLSVVGLAAAPWLVKTARYGWALLASSATMLGFIATLGLGMYPSLVPALNPGLSLTIYNASSSALTLKAMLIIALTGMPIVLFYTIYVYRVFRGKVDIYGEGYSGKNNHGAWPPGGGIVR